MRESRSEFDLAVIGAGPGGCACALAAARGGLRVALLDPRPEADDRPCGEGMMPEGAASLASLGLQDLLARGRAFRSLRFFLGGEPLLEVPLPAPAVAIPRPELLRSLDGALSREPKILRVRSAARAERTGRFEVRAEDGHALAADALAVADGGGGRALEGLREGGAPRRFGLRARYEETRPLESVEIHLGGEVEVYLTPLPGGIVNAAFLFSRAPSGARGPEDLARRALERHPAAAAQLGATLTAPQGRTLGLPRPRAVAEGRSFLVGDATGGVDPIVGCGVTVALRTGIAAAEAALALRGGMASASVERRHAEAVRREVDRRRTLAGLLLRLADRPRFARGAALLLRRMPGLLARLARVAAGT